MSVLSLPLIAVQYTEVYFDQRIDLRVKYRKQHSVESYEYDAIRYFTWYMNPNIFFVQKDALKSEKAFLR